MDPDMISNFAIDLNLDHKNRSAQFMQRQPDYEGHQPTRTESADSGRFCSTPSDVKTVTFNPEVTSIDSCVYAHQHSKKSRGWPFFPRNSRAESCGCSTPNLLRNEAALPKTILNKRGGTGEPCFARAEVLPLLSGLSSGFVERTSPSFVRRKKYVYPTVSSFVNNRDESSL